MPKITYERIDTGKKISVIENDTTDLGEWISRISKEEIQSKGLLISKNIKDENKELAIKDTLRHFDKCPFITKAFQE